MDPWQRSMGPVAQIFPKHDGSRNSRSVGSPIGKSGWQTRFQQKWSIWSSGPMLLGGLVTVIVDLATARTLAHFYQSSPSHSPFWGFLYSSSFAPAASAAWQLGKSVQVWTYKLCIFLLVIDLAISFHPSPHQDYWHFFKLWREHSCHSSQQSSCFCSNYVFVCFCLLIKWFSDHKLCSMTCFKAGPRPLELDAQNLA